ncbi:hypothetical protein N9L68_05285, partial [bacterium]|nr:hypothetical protein [bacterium]
MSLKVGVQDGEPVVRSKRLVVSWNSRVRRHEPVARKSKSRNWIWDWVTSPHIWSLSSLFGIFA